MTELSALLAEPRVKIVAELRPLAGTRFQPTGFPDLGAATYPSPVDGTRLLLVESAQSMANRLEATLWDDATQSPIELVDRLPYVRVFDKDGEYLTSSRTESHRLASAYVKDAQFDGQSGLDILLDRLGLQKQRPIDHPRVQRAIFDLDPLCLLHGVFFADNKWFGQPKLPRAVTAFIEAADVQEAYSGGVKFDHVSNTGDRDQNQGSKEGFGNVPFPRTEYVARLLEASFLIDVSQIRRYTLDQREKELLLALALFEVRALLDEGLRLRTACDFDVVALRGERPEGFGLPGSDLLAGWISERIGDALPPLNGVFG